MNFYFITLLILSIIIIGMCVPNLVTYENVLKQENFSMPDASYYDWGLRKIRKQKHHKRKHHPGERPYQPPMFQNYSDGEYKCYYEPSAKKKLSCQQALSSCPIKYHPQRDKYILKSEIPPMPNMEDYVLKSAIPPAECPPEKECPPHPDMNLYIHKDNVPQPKSCAKCPTCPTCPVMPSKRPKSLLKGLL